MNETSIEIQSSKTLFRATAAAVVLAVVVLVTIILPAEYNIDPTGIGHSIGLTQLANAASITPVQAEIVEVSLANLAQQPESRSDSVTIEIPGGKGLEYKFHLLKHAEMDYAWTTDGALIYFDFHGEPQGDTSGYYKSFTISTANQAQGSLVTPFEGSHGWYWRNDSPIPVTITLKTSGDYQVIGLRH